jgi:DNA-binding NtrC family response regulator
MNPVATFWFSENSVKDFGINIPPESGKYTLCLRKLKEDSFENTDGLVDFVDKKIELNDVLKHLNIPKQDQYLPAHINGYKQQDERQLLFGALFELKKDIMDIKHQLSAMEDMKSSNEPENGFYVSDEKIDNITFDEFEQELLTYYFKKYQGNINKIADKLKISNRTLYRKFKLYGLKNGKVY